MNREDITDYKRKPIETEVRYDPRDIPPPFLRLGLIGSETEIDVLVDNGSARSQSIFDVLVDDYSPHVEEFKASGFNYISISDTPFPVELLGNRSALEKYREEYLEKDKLPVKKKSKELVDGSAQDIFEQVKILFGSNLPTNTVLEFDEQETSQSAGTLTDDHNEYSGKLSIKLRLKGTESDGSYDRVISVLSLKSRNTYNEPSSAGMMGNNNSYSYEITREKLEKIVEK